MMSKAGAGPSGQCPQRERSPKLKVKRSFNWTAKKTYRKGEVFNTSKCSQEELARIAVMCDSGGFFER